MIFTDKEYGQFDICLADDGTLDTVITVDPLNDLVLTRPGNKRYDLAQNMLQSLETKRPAQ